MNKKKDVTKFLDDLNLPLRSEIETLRELILSAENELTESIKWNGPNYAHHGEDRITMRILPPQKLQLIFHRGAKKLLQPENRLINDPTGLLMWKENDRAIATFKSLEDIKNAEAAIVQIVQDWIEAS